MFIYYKTITTKSRYHLSSYKVIIILLLYIPYAVNFISVTDFFFSWKFWSF